MRTSRSIVAAGITGAALTLSALVAPGAGAKPPVEVLLDDLSSPKGISLAPGGDPVVSQGAFGAPGPVVQFLRTGKAAGTAAPVTDPLSLVDVAVAANGQGWGLGSDQVLYLRSTDGTVEPVLDIAGYQSTDPDPFDTEDLPTESNPYGLAALPGGDALVVDAAGNDVIRVTPEGDAWTVARLDVEVVSTAHLPDFPAPAIPAEAVPTTAALGPDGMLYIGELKGFPFAPGSSNIWKVDPAAEGATCSTDPTVAVDCVLAHTGFTGIQDIAFGSNGRLHVLELAEGGVLAFEGGFETGEFPPAVLLEVKGQKRTRLDAGEISQPGGLVVDRGAVYVTDQVFTGGRLLRIRG